MDITKLTKEGEDDILSHYRTFTNKYGEQVNVPVVDVRDGISYRMMAYQMKKAHNKSEWIPYSEYQRSKPKTPPISI
jgi:hypothetical protein